MLHVHTPYYVGNTRDLDQRVYQHQIGAGARYTARWLPVSLAWFEEVGRIDEAFELEKRLQNWSRAKRKALIDGRYADLPALSRGKTIRRGS